MTPLPLLRRIVITVALAGACGPASAQDAAGAKPVALTPGVPVDLQIRADRLAAAKVDGLRFAFILDLPQEALASIERSYHGVPERRSLMPRRGQWSSVDSCGSCG